MSKSIFLRQFTFLIFLILLVVAPVKAQQKDSLKAQLTTRYMHTYNAPGLKNFQLGVSHGHVFYGRKLNDWLRVGAQVNGLIHYGIDNISEPDAITGSGPIYEGNLWVRKNMTGRTHFGLSQLHLQARWGRHSITVGQFLKNTPLINIEPWPFPNAMEGVWYEYKGKRKWDFQRGFINRIAPRQSGRFANIGRTLGEAGSGRDIFGQSSQYAGQVNSDFILVGNAHYAMDENWSFDTWNYFADNLFNVFLLEPKWQSDEKDWRVMTKFIYQRKIGEGGNENPLFTYMEDGDFADAYYLGLRVEKKLGEGLLQVNLSRIADQGRLLLPKEWGLEPFYAFQRRTRVEGAVDVFGFMVKYQHVWEDDRGKLRVFASAGRTDMPTPFDAARNKFGTPSFSHWDFSPRYDFKQGLFKNMSFELYTAIRFLADDIQGNKSFQINRNNIFHMDAILSWRL